MMWIAGFVTAALIVILMITLSNLLFFPRLTVKHASITPMVSVLIPARNEVKVIEKTLTLLLAQDYPHFEVIVLDDNSTDGTDTALKKFQDARLKIINGAPLPDGWMGKNWACHQLQAEATGAFLIFTDADVQWSQAALSTVVTILHDTHADLFTVWPTQETVTWGERLVVPLMSLVVMGYLPILGTHYLPLAGFGAANGQCMAWRKEAYHAIGGHQSVRDNVLEDVTMARKVKQQRLRLRMADGNQLIRCRMYTNWGSVRDGYAKNILAGYGNSVLLLIGASVFHFLLFLFPFIWMFYAPMWGFGLLIIGIGVRAITARFTHQRVQDALLMPVSVLLMTRIAFHAIYWHVRYGAPLWKGRIIHTRNVS
jgi:chlorobactene glucosyltransferase